MKNKTILKQKFKKNLDNKKNYYIKLAIKVNIYIYFRCLLTIRLSSKIIY